MATLTTTLASFDRSQLLALRNGRASADDFLPRSHHGLFMLQSGGLPIRPRHYLDDTDLLTLRRQYDNLDLLEHSRLSNSAEDLSQIENHMNYPFDLFEHDGMEEDDVPFDDSLGYDYSILIQERLKKANEEFHDDQTPIELKHTQRIAFDPVVRAVDFVQDPDEHDHTIELFNQASMSTLVEDPTSIRNQMISTNTPTHQYTVPLNDTQPRQGLTLLEQLKAMQFHSPNDHWTNSNGQNDDLTSNSRPNDLDLSNLTTSFSSTEQPMVVALNGKFDLRNTNDYLAKKPYFTPAPPPEPKKGPIPSRRQFTTTRPKSSDINKRTNPSTSNDTSQKARPKSAGVSTNEKSSSGVDFNELLRKSAEKKRAELREERRKKEEADEKRQQERIRAEQAYQRWVNDKNAERKRINEEKRLEREEFEAFQVENSKRLEELRREKYRQWIERKNYQTMIENEFRKLQAGEEEITSEGSSISSKNSQKVANQRAFQRWLRRKYRQALEEKRHERAEKKRHPRRSIKRRQLHQHLQLAKSYGYT